MKDEFSVLAEMINQASTTGELISKKITRSNITNRLSVESNGGVIIYCIDAVEVTATQALIALGADYLN